jgi:hypothetical protein
MESIEQLLRLIPKYDTLPEIVRALLPMLVSCVVVFALLALAVLFAVWLERTGWVPCTWVVGMDGRRRSPMR